MTILEKKLNAKEELEVFKNLIETRLECLVPKIENEPYSVLYQAARYSLLGGGKRLRPLLLLSTLSTLKSHYHKGLDTACAIEMVHAYSLIHDDLPCMDNDDFRRGMPTCHKVFGEAIALLAGDFLLTDCFKIISNDENLHDAQKIKVIKLLSNLSGGTGMIAGQALDFLETGKKIDIALLQQIHHLKTGALIQSAIECALVIAETPTAISTQISSFGKHFGLLFQIIDDILDVTDSISKHGKSTSSDESKNKPTYVSLLGFDKATLTAKKLGIECREILQHLNLTNSPLQSILENTLQKLPV